MYLGRARSDLICAIKSRAWHAMRNVESFYFFLFLFFFKKDNVYARRTSNQRRKKRKTIHRDCIRDESREFFLHQENGRDRIRPNVERFRGKYAYYVNLRDKSRDNAIQGIGIKILIIQNGMYNYIITNDK